MNGFIISHRKVWENPIFKGNAERVGVWDWMLKMAAYKDTTQIVGGEVVEVRRGQLCVSQSQIIEATGMARQPLRTFLNMLEKTTTISTRPATNATKGRTLITICNYEEYQAPQTAPNQASTKEQPKNNQLKKQGNKVTIEAKASRARGTRLPDDWFLPVEYGQWAVEQGWPESVVRCEAEKFKDHWHGVAGAHGRKANWLATWRNWMRNSKSPKAINGGRNERPDTNRAGSQRFRGSETSERADPALEQIARLAGVSQASGNGGV